MRDSAREQSQAFQLGCLLQLPIEGSVLGDIPDIELNHLVFTFAIQVAHHLRLHMPALSGLQRHFRKPHHSFCVEPDEDGLSVFQFLERSHFPEAFPDQLLAAIAAQLNGERIHVRNLTGFAIDDENAVLGGFKKTPVFRFDGSLAIGNVRERQQDEARFAAAIDSAGIELKDSPAHTVEVMLNFDVLDLSISSVQDFVEHLMNLGEVPLAVTKLVNDSVQGFVGRNAERVEEGAVRGLNAQLRFEHQQRLPDGRQDRLRVIPSLFGMLDRSF